MFYRKEDFNMIFLHNNPKKTKVVNEQDIKELGENIAHFVNSYEKYLYVLDDPDDKTFIYLNELKKVVKLIEQRRYSELFEDDTEIIYDIEYYTEPPF